MNDQPPPTPNSQPPTPTRVALIVPGFSADAADWCIPALTNLVRALAARPGVEVHVYTLRYPHRRATYRLHGATIHAFGGAPFGTRRVWGASLGRLWAAFLVALRQDHRRAPFAVLHGFWATESGTLTALAGRLLGIPTLVHLAGGELTHLRTIGYGNRAPGLARLLVAGSLRLAGHLTVPSGPMLAQLRRYAPHAAAKAVPWPFGVDLQMFTPPPPKSKIQSLPSSAAKGPKSSLRLVHAASLLPVKNQALLLDGLALARAAAPALAITLTIAGTGPLAEPLRTHAARLGLGDAVTFLGEIRHEALPALYRAHDAFVLTSHHEAQCMALLEAAACGLPWISPPVGAAADLARHHPAGGWRVPPRDPAALSRAILAATASDRRAHAAAAAAAIAADYALETQTDRLLALYKRVRTGQPPTPLPAHPTLSS